MRRIYAQMLELHGDTAAAVTEYERLIGEGSSDAIALNNLAWQYAEEGRDGAVELAQRAHEILPNNGNITDTLGWILYRQGEFSEALGLLREAREQAPNNPEIRFHLATVLAETDNASEAQAELDALLREFESFQSREQAEALARTL
jgi:tetratricopeptide (TPR) repeat protein